MSDTSINEYENVSGGWVGVKVEDHTHRTGFRGMPVAPGARVSLSERERVATANAPRREADNPFANGALRLIAVDQQSTQQRPIGDGEPQPPEPPEEPKPKDLPEEAQGDAQGSQEGQKPESEMTEAEIADHNRKAAAARAVPTKEPPTPPPAAPAQTEQVGTPDATAAAGKKPEGQRAATEQVGTPEAAKK